MDVHFTTRVQQHYGVDRGIPREDAKAVRIVEKASAIAREALAYKILDNQDINKTLLACEGMAPNAFAADEILRNVVLTLNNNQKYLQACLEQLNSYLEKLSNNALSEEERAWLHDNAPALLEYLEEVSGLCQEQQEELSRHAAALQSKLDPLNVAVDKLKNRIAQAANLLEEEDSSSESSSEEEPGAELTPPPEPFSLEKGELFSLSPSLRDVHKKQRESKKLAREAQEMVAALNGVKKSLKHQKDVPSLNTTADPSSLIQALDEAASSPSPIVLDEATSQRIAFYSQAAQVALQKIGVLSTQYAERGQQAASEARNRLEEVESDYAMWRLATQKRGVPRPGEYVRSLSNILPRKIIMHLKSLQFLQKIHTRSLINTCPISTLEIPARSPRAVASPAPSKKFIKILRENTHIQELKLSEGHGWLDVLAQLPSPTRTRAHSPLREVYFLRSSFPEGVDFEGLLRFVRANRSVTHLALDAPLNITLEQTQHLVQALKENPTLLRVHCHGFDDRSYTSFYYGYKEIIERNLAAYDLLVDALKKGNLTVVDRVISGGLSPYVLLDKNGRCSQFPGSHPMTLLHLAVWENQLPVAAYLAENFHLLNKKDGHGRTPYELARELKHKEMAKQLAGYMDRGDS